MQKYYVYILQSSGGRYYIGFTSNLARRISQHNKKHKGFTGRKSEEWTLVSSLELPDKLAAVEMERRLKSFKSSSKAIGFLKNQKGSEHPDFVGTRPLTNVGTRPVTKVGTSPAVNCGTGLPE